MADVTHGNLTLSSNYLCVWVCVRPFLCVKRLGAADAENVRNAVFCFNGIIKKKSVSIKAER